MSLPASYALRSKILGTSPYDLPEPLVRLPASAVPKADAETMTALTTALDEAVLQVEAVTDAADDTEPTPANRRAWETKRDEMAARIAAGDPTANVADALPVYDPAQALAAFEVLLFAVKAARHTARQAVRAYDAKVAEIALDAIPAAVKSADALEAKALAAEAIAATARSKANEARSLTFDLRVPQAVAAYRAAGLDGHAEGFQATYLAPRLVRSAALVSPLLGWSTEEQHYYRPEIARHLGVTLGAPAPKPTPEEEAALARLAHARGDRVAANIRTYAKPSAS